MSTPPNKRDNLVEGFDGPKMMKLSTREQRKDLARGVTRLSPEFKPYSRKSGKPRAPATPLSPEQRLILKKKHAKEIQKMLY